MGLDPLPTSVVSNLCQTSDHVDVKDVDEDSSMIHIEVSGDINESLIRLEGLV